MNLWCSWGEGGEGLEDSQLNSPDPFPSPPNALLYLNDPFICSQLPLVPPPP